MDINDKQTLQNIVFEETRKGQAKQWSSIGKCKLIIIKQYWNVGKYETKTQKKDKSQRGKRRVEQNEELEIRFSYLLVNL